jgi:hypothetical protein
MEQFGLDGGLQVSYEECFTVDYEGKLERVESEGSWDYFGGRTHTYPGSCALAPFFLPACGYTPQKVNSTYGKYDRPQFP